MLSRQARLAAAGTAVAPTACGHRPPGLTGATGATGAQGAAGPQGPAGPFPDGPLPAGKTLRGTYSVQLPDGAITGGASVPISFGLTLASEPKVVVVAQGQSPKPAGCPGTIYLPQANAGFLCIYRQFENGLSAPIAFRLASAGLPDNSVAEGPLIGRIGGTLDMDVTGTTVHLARGTWAVTSS